MVLCVSDLCLKHEKRRGRHRRPRLNDLHNRGSTLYGRTATTCSITYTSAEAGVSSGGDTWSEDHPCGSAHAQEPTDQVFVSGVVVAHHRIGFLQGYEQYRGGRGNCQATHGQFEFNKGGMGSTADANTSRTVGDNAASTCLTLAMKVVLPGRRWREITG